MNHENPMPRRGDLVLTPTGLLAYGRRLPCTVGRGGITADKREGDGATPVGVHRIVQLFHRPDRTAPPAPWSVPIGPRDLWSDDPRDPAYNSRVTAPHAFSHEALRRADPQYDLVLVTDWNWAQPIPGKGSAIFLHRWRRPCAPTAGCIAMAASDLFWLAKRLRPGGRLIIRAR
jgi:L,D-peptidoglycan transpeptidase YkuD (ErfK/YbiS/YcfS/YnhG family)